MTPDDFPTREKYLSYVRECEDSLVYDTGGDAGPHTFETITELVINGNHWSECKDKEEPNCWCEGDEYGLIYSYSIGIMVATHTTNTMFSIKNDHWADGDCAWCHPQNFYWGPRMGKLSYKQANLKWWEDQHYAWEGSYVEYFDECNLPRPAWEPDKIGPHP